jgi:single-strand DNA-binding protein
MATDRPRAATTPAGDAAAETTDWHRIVAWEKLAETCHRYLTKGQQVCVEGRIRNRKWTTTEGQKRTSSEVVATDVMFLSPKRDGPAEASVATPFDPTEAW